jgi:hypothetical protein
MLHMFLATCHAIVLLRDVKLPNTSLHYTPLMFSQHIENSSLISLINISQLYILKLQEKLHRVTWSLLPFDSVIQYLQIPNDRFSQYQHRSDLWPLKARWYIIKLLNFLNKL